jgi:Methyltransferase domain
MHYLAALKEVHEALKPRSYVEIGCRFGNSLVLADCPAIGVDPLFRLRQSIGPNVRLFEETSDAFFADHHLTALLGSPFHLAFIDGMHLAEYALRDFINLEKHAGPHSVIVFDDILPGPDASVSREEVKGLWCGDVYKALRIIKALRPDLHVAVFDVAIKGIGIVSNLDPHSTILESRYAALEASILAGEYDLDDRSQLRDEFGVRPVEALRAHILTLASAARGPAEEPGS